MALVKYNNRSIRNLTTAPAAAASSPGALVHIKTLTASSSGTLSFVNGSSSVVLNNTYSVYKFEFINIHPSAHIEFAFNASVDTGSNYNVAKTTTTVASWHAENGASSGISYIDEDLAQGTGVARISGNLYTDNDSSMSGTLTLFNPSSTTFVKHFLADTQRMDYSSQGYTNRWLSSGYINSTSAVDAIQFSMVSGNIDAGKITLYGIKES